jgi:HPt (histidine-containing phosphotransfer) domain-containing protein
MDATPVLDAEQVADLIALDQGRGAVFAQFVDALLAGADARIARLRQQADCADTAALAATAHAFTGSAGNLGAARLACLLGRIEAAGKRRDVAAVQDLLGLLDAEYAAARAALLAAIGREKSGKSGTDHDF